MNRGYLAFRFFVSYILGGISVYCWQDASERLAACDFVKKERGFSRHMATGNPRIPAPKMLANLRLLGADL